MRSLAEVFIPSNAVELDGAEFAARVQQLQRRLFQIAYGVLGDAADAEEVVQDAFVRAYRHFASLREPDKFRAWISRIAFRLALNRRRTRRRQLDRDTTWHSARPDPVVDGARKGVDRLLLERVRMEIEQLPEKLRDVLLLSAVEGMEAPEIAGVLNIPAGTVRSRLYLARKRLLEVMER